MGEIQRLVIHETSPLHTAHSRTTAPSAEDTLNTVFEKRRDDGGLRDIECITSRSSHLADSPCLGKCERQIMKWFHCSRCIFAFSAAQPRS